MTPPARLCEVCGHPAREAIEEALAGGYTLATQWAFADVDPPSRYALGRHRAMHLSPELQEILRQTGADRAVDRSAANWTPDKSAQLNRDLARIDRKLAALHDRSHPEGDYT
jgi:hypothetical protein